MEKQIFCMFEKKKYKNRVAWKVPQLWAWLCNPKEEEWITFTCQNTCFRIPGSRIVWILFICICRWMIFWPTLSRQHQNQQWHKYVHEHDSFSAVNDGKLFGNLHEVQTFSDIKGKGITTSIVHFNNMRETFICVGVYWAHVYKGPSRGPCVGVIYTHLLGLEEYKPLFSLTVTSSEHSHGFYSWIDWTLENYSEETST